jgi:hypothetical protein
MKSPSPPSSVTLSVNTILHGVWHSAGSPIPVNELPSHLKRYIAKPQEESDQPQERNLAFSLHTSYGVDERGYRYLRREAQQLNAAAELEEALQAPLPKEVAEQLQNQHQANVNRQIVEGQAAARRHDQAQEFVRQQEEENAQVADADGFAQQTTEILFGENVLKATPKLKLRRRFVKRGFAFRKAKDPNVKLKKGERVFIKDGSHYEEIGVVGLGGSLPKAYVETKEAH